MNETLSLKLLIIEDDRKYSSLLKSLFPRDDVKLCEDLETAKNELNRMKPNAVILDACFPNKPNSEIEFNAENFLNEVEKIPNSKKPDVLLISGKDQAAEYIREGLVGGQFFSVVPKSVSMEMFKVLVELSVDQLRWDLERRPMVAEFRDAQQAFFKNNFLTVCPAILRMWDSILRVADSNCKVLIRGERGTGKGVMARMIHNESMRKNAPFVRLNFANINPEIVDSTLFGVKANFPGYHNKEPLVGKLEAANGGTLFIDEIGTIPLETQTKLLSVLEENEFCRIGENNPIRLDFRLITATNEDLQKAIDKQQFRSDLYDRLNVISITLPPLRDRGDGDLNLLIERFMEKQERKIHLNKEIISVLKNYRWPGNVRQLQNVIERISIVAATDRPSMNDLHMVLEEFNENSKGDPNDSKDTFVLEEKVAPIVLAVKNLDNQQHVYGPVRMDDKSDPPIDPFWPTTLSEQKAAEILTDNGREFFRTALREGATNVSDNSALSRDRKKVRASVRWSRIICYLGDLMKTGLPVKIDKHIAVELSDRTIKETTAYYDLTALSEAGILRCYTSRNENVYTPADGIFL